MIAQSLVTQSSFILRHNITRVKLQILLHYLLIYSQFTGAKPIHINEVCDFGFQRAVLTLILMPRKTDKQAPRLKKIAC